jgi:long-chain-fatty-acyl-CoA reductase
MSEHVIDVPLIVNGVPRRPDGPHDPDVHLLRFESGAAVRIPRFHAEDLAAVQAAGPEIDAELAQISTAEIISFLGKVGELWDARKLAARMFVRHEAHRLTQFSDVMMERDYETIGHFLAQRWHLYDQIESEFGDQRVFDEWLPVQMSYRRAFPRGLVLHYLVGNLPLASMYSLCRGMVTTNRSLAKLPSRDPVSPSGLALALIEVDPQHPVSRALTLAYWPHGDPVGDAAISVADAACVWGGEAAVRSVRDKLGVNVPLVEYGPRHSASVVDLTVADVDEAAMRVVEDAAFYDQEACFNTQRVFVRGDVDAFVAAARRSFATFAENLPFVTRNRDILANRSALLAEARFRGFETTAAADWAVVSVPPGTTDLPHPLSRTLYVHPVQELGEVVTHLDRHSQTLSVFPWDLVPAWRDTWARAGTDRLVEAGFSRMPRAGFTHDGGLGMHGMTRLVSVERSWDDPGRYYTRREDPGQHYLVDRYARVRATLAADTPPERVATGSGVPADGSPVPPAAPISPVHLGGAR